jgi:hypothetical protein
LFPTGTVVISHLLYTSNLSGSQSPACVIDIVRRSRVRNLGSQITGYLMFDGASFIQFLEGNPSAVEQTWQRIQQDARHEDLSVLHRDMISGSRRFETSLVYALDHDSQSRLLLQEHRGADLIVALERLLVRIGAAENIRLPQDSQATRG